VTDQWSVESGPAAIRVEPTAFSTGDGRRRRRARVARRSSRLWCGTTAVISAYTASRPEGVWTAV